jgi:hypothetical protein
VQNSPALLIKNFNNFFSEGSNVSKKKLEGIHYTEFPKSICCNGLLTAADKLVLTYLIHHNDYFTKHGLYSKSKIASDNSLTLQGLAKCLKKLRKLQLISYQNLVNLNNCNLYFADDLTAYYQLPNSIRSNKSLSFSTKIVFMYLLDRYKFYEGNFFESYGTISKNTAMSINSVKRAYNELRGMNYITAYESFKPSLNVDIIWDESTNAVVPEVIKTSIPTAVAPEAIKSVAPMPPIPSVSVSSTVKASEVIKSVAPMPVIPTVTPEVISPHSPAIFDEFLKTKKSSETRREIDWSCVGAEEIAKAQYHQYND